MVSAETLLSYPGWTMTSTVHTDASDKQLGAVISKNNKPIDFFSIILSKPQCNYTTDEKEILAIVECLKQFLWIIFGYKIKVCSDHKNLVYAATLSEYQRVMCWRLMIEEFGPAVQHINWSENIVSDTLIRFPYASIDKYDTSTMKDQCLANELFAIVRAVKNEYCFPLDILNVKI